MVAQASTCEARSSYYAASMRATRSLLPLALAGAIALSVPVPAQHADPIALRAERSG